MKYTAHRFGRFELSAAQLISVADANGRTIDCRGYNEALALLAVGDLAGTDPVLDVKWQESADDSTWADITSGAHKQVLWDNNKVVVSVDLTNVALTIAAQPANPSRIQAIVTDTTSGITVGTIYIIGTDVEDNVQTELLTVAAWSSPTTMTGTKVFKTITSVTAGVHADESSSVDFATLGGSSDETIVVGVNNSGKYCPHIGRFDLTKRMRYLRAVPVRGGTTPTGGYSAGLYLMSKQHSPAIQVVGAAGEFNL